MDQHPSCMVDIKRRSLLRSAGATASITGLTTVVGGSQSGKYTEIVTVVSGDEIIRKRKVPKSWYNRVQRTRNVSKRIKKNHRNEPGVKGVSRTAGDTRFGNKKGPEIRVSVEPESYNGNIPDEVDNIPVRKVKAQKAVKTCQNQEDFEQIPGGVHLNSNGSKFTSMARVERGGFEYLLTAAHVWEACSDSEAGEGEPVEQHHDEFGEVGHLHPTMDLARIDLTNVDYSYDGAIEASDKRYYVEGVATRDGLDNFMSVNKDIRKVGISTGDTTGQIEEIEFDNAEGCVDFNSEGVKLTNNQAGGDSGGPGFIPYDSGWCTLININTFGYGPSIGTACEATLYGAAGGTAGYEIENYLYKFV